MDDQGDRLSGLDLERHVFENPVVALVSKPDVLKFNMAHGAARLGGFSWRGDSDGQVERLEDAMRRYDSRLQHIVLIRNIANRLEKETRILDEGHQCPQRKHGVSGRVLHHPTTAVPDDQGDAYSADEINQRK